MRITEVLRIFLTTRRNFFFLQCLPATGIGDHQETLAESTVLGQQAHGHDGYTRELKAVAFQHLPHRSTGAILSVLDQPPAFWT
jgi:hypothetical protein